jgi:hypothetical protein
MRTIPFPFLDARNDQLVTIANLVDKLAQYTLAQQNTRVKKVSRNSKKRDYILEELERELNDYIFECFHLNEQEIQHIRATVQFTIDFFNSPEKSLALQRPAMEMLQSYAESYIRLINFYLEPVGKKLTATVYVAEKSPLHTIRFSSRLLSEDVPNIDLSLPNDYMRRALSELNILSNERVSQRMYHRRNFRIYNNNEDALYIVKPAEQRHWTVSAALKDAEETVAELTQPIRV